MTPQAALDAPRFCISAGLPDSADEEEAESSGSGSAGDINSEVNLEEGISLDVIKKLGGKSQLHEYTDVRALLKILTLRISEMGHDVRHVTGQSNGS